MKTLYKVFTAVAIVFTIQACKTTVPVVVPEEVVLLDTIQINSDSERELYRASEKRINDLLHTKLEVKFDWDSAFLYGQANLTLTPYFYPTNELILDAKGFQIHKVALVDNIGKQTPLQYSYDSLLLKIDLGKRYTRKDTYNIFVDYTAMPNKLKAGGSAAITQDKGLYFINPDGKDPNKPKQIWTQGETESSSCWFPTIDSPNEKTSQEIYMTVDEKYVTLSNGSLIFQTENEDGTRTDYWKQNLSHAPYLFMMAVGEFAVVEDKWRDIPVNYYVEPKYEAFAKDIYPNTPEMIEFFSTKLGYDYPWDKYHQIVVRDYVSGAMENTGGVIFGDFIQGDDRFLIDNSGEDIVAHELFHHWFGDLVTCESWSNLPLNESFATYGEYLWNEYKYGKDQADLHGRNDLRVYLSQARVNKKKLIRFNYENRMEMFDSHSYQKGGRILHMLRNYVGDEAFFNSLQLYLKTNEFQTVEIHQLRLAFEEVTGEDLNWFFNQWFLGAGHPIIEIEKEYDAGSDMLSVTIKQTQDGEGVAEIFEVPTKIGIVGANGKLRVEEIRLTERTETFNFSMKEEPKLVNFDWDKVLLGEIEQAVEKSEAVTLYNSCNNYIDKYEAIKMLKSKKDSASLDVIEKALNDSFWHIRKTAIANSKKLAKARSASTLAKLKKLAKEDPKSSVRAAAISAISKYFEDDVNAAFFNESINDRSFIVVSSGLDAIYSKDKQQGIKTAEMLEKEENPSILLTVANIYAEEGGKNRKAFYDNALNNLTGFNKYPMLLSYGEYLEKQDDEMVDNAISQLTDVGMGTDSWFVRMAAINNIIKIRKNKKEEVKKLSERITNETDAKEIERLTKEKAAAEAMNKKLVEALEKINKEEENKNLKRMLEGELK